MEKRFIGSVCADAGYKFEIDVPEDMTETQTEKLIDYLLGWQAPDMGGMDDGVFKEACEDLESNEPELFNEIKGYLSGISVYFDCVHRSYFVNEIEEN